jgi:hypothetical protein
VQAPTSRTDARRRGVSKVRRALASRDHSGILNLSQQRKRAPIKAFSLLSPISANQAMRSLRPLFRNDDDSGVLFKVKPSSIRVDPALRHHHPCIARLHDSRRHHFKHRRPSRTNTRPRSISTRSTSACVQGELWKYRSVTAKDQRTRLCIKARVLFSQV